MTTTTTTYVDNILDIFDRASESEYRHGMSWYNGANAIAWTLDPLNYKRAAGVMAAMSPLLRWDKTVEYSKMLYSGADIEDIPYIRKNVIKAFAIKNGWNVLDVLSGPKVTAFYHNIVDPYSHDYNNITVDKHAFDIANMLWDNPYQGGRTVTRKEYPIIASAYVDAADIVGILPLQMQAITWETWRNIKNGR